MLSCQLWRYCQITFVLAASFKVVRLSYWWMRPIVETPLIPIGYSNTFLLTCHGRGVIALCPPAIFSLSLHLDCSSIFTTSAVNRYGYRSSPGAFSLTASDSFSLSIYSSTLRSLFLSPFLDLPPHSCPLCFLLSPHPLPSSLGVFPF